MCRLGCQVQVIGVCPHCPVDWAVGANPGRGVGDLGTLVGWFFMKDRVYGKVSSMHAFASHEQSGHFISQISELAAECSVMWTAFLHISMGPITYCLEPREELT